MEKLSFFPLASEGRDYGALSMFKLMTLSKIENYVVI